MTFTPDQVTALKADLNRGHVAQREQAGRKLSYIEAWWAIAEANRIFGFDGWNRETIDLRLLGEPRLVGDKWRVGYMARVRITVTTHDDGFRTEITREGCGFGSGIDKDVDQAHESALKEAESDAMKRALMTFGNPFGLALYDKTQAHVSNAPPPAATLVGRIEQVLDEDLTRPMGRKSAAQSKRDGDDAKIKGDIAKCNAAGLRDWHENFDSYTAHIPVSWLDSIRDMLELRLEELNAEPVEGAEQMDEAFRATTGRAGSGGMARNGSAVAA